MQSISDIHSRILSEYDALQNQYKGEEKAWLDALYLSYPEVAAIDSSIASLAVKSAKAIIDGRVEISHLDSACLAGTLAKLTADTAHVAVGAC